ncbi:MAG: pirin family protein [Myxococcales bacterium]|nr:pirin family protein [Myxococcales bacterium]
MACRDEPAPDAPSPVLEVRALGGNPWPTEDPFLFCVHHLDAYPKGDARMAPVSSLAGRDMGQDFSGRDGWSMYHGQVVPGFPRHPHRGFETVTVTRRGYVDHSDSLGATARYGEGDVQWMTAGQGIVHAEMFPLREEAEDNPLELFQLWLNLPARSKMVKPYFSMFWKDSVPVHALKDGEGRAVTVTTVAGALQDSLPPAPPPASWAAQEGADVAIWTITMAPGARFTLPAGASGLNRAVYVFRGSAEVGGRRLDGERAMLRSEQAALLIAGASGAEVLLLQGRPIGEPVAHYGPFVMNTRAELQQAFMDYQRTGFGGWPWQDDAPVHARPKGRFAVHADGRLDEPKVG